MPAHRFKVEIAGQTLHGVAFASEAELEQFVGTRGTLPILDPRGSKVEAPTTCGDPVAAGAIRPIGRPRRDQIISEAVHSLSAQLDPSQPLSVRARLVLRHLAETNGPDDMPSSKTVERFLSDPPVRQNSRQKGRQKSARAKLFRNGGL